MNETVGKPGRRGQILILLFVLICTALILMDLAANVSDLNKGTIGTDKPAAALTERPLMTTQTATRPRPTSTRVMGPTEGPMMEDEG